MGYICPYCHQSCFDNGEIHKKYYPSFSGGDLSEMTDDAAWRSSLEVEFSLCPNCGNVALHIIPYWKNKKMHFSFSYPNQGAIEIPEYVPEAIKRDYLEAVQISELSPKAAATLARRCLQGMIHDFWGIREKNLNAEITSLKDKVSVSQWNAIDGLRKIGNIGAHMEKDVELIIDVDPNEAQKLLKLIELLIQKWYIARHDEEQLLADITSMADAKESERRSGPSGE